MRKLMWFTLGFGAACIFGAYFYVPWLLCVAVVAFVLSIGCLIGMRWLRCLRIGVALLLGAAIGLGWFTAFDRLYLASARNADGQSMTASIPVGDFSFETGSGSGFDGTVILGKRTYRVRAYLDTVEVLSPGDSVSGTFSFRMTKGDTDQNSYPGKGIYLLAYQDGDCQMESGEPSFFDYPAIWRLKLKQITRKKKKEEPPGEAGGSAYAGIALVY